MSGQSEFSFADRYGVRKAPQWQLPATIIAILGVCWVLWAGWHHAHPQVRATLISFNVTGEKSVSMRYEVIRRDANQEISCTLVARDFVKNVIGQIEDLIPAGEITVTREVTIPTRTKPVNAAVLDCSAN